MRASTLATLLDVVTVPETTSPGATTSELSETLRIRGAASGGSVTTLDGDALALGIGPGEASMPLAGGGDGPVNGMAEGEGTAGSDDVAGADATACGVADTGAGEALPGAAVGGAGEGVASDGTPDVAGTGDGTLDGTATCLGASRSLWCDSHSSVAMKAAISNRTSDSKNRLRRLAVRMRFKHVYPFARAFLLLRLRMISLGRRTGSR
jgi:hypothetical protein